MATFKSRQVGRVRQRIVQADDLEVGVNGRSILQLKNFVVESGQVVAVTGCSGVGKTTLLSCLAGESVPISGTLTLTDGVEPDQLASYASRTIQSFPLFHWLTVRENLLLKTKIKGTSPDSINGTLAAFSAQGVADRYPNSLSGGERCRASLSQALIGSPKLLLLDEPFTGLDLVNRRSIASNIFRWSRESQAGVVLVTHDIHDAVKYADTVIVLQAGSPGSIAAEINTQTQHAHEEVVRALVDAGDRG